MTGRELVVRLAPPQKALGLNHRGPLSAHTQAIMDAQIHARIVADSAMAEAGFFGKPFRRASVSVLWHTAPRWLSLGEYKPLKLELARYAIGPYLRGIETALNPGGSWQLVDVPIGIERWNFHARVIFNIRELEAY